MTRFFAALALSLCILGGVMSSASAGANNPAGRYIETLGNQALLVISDKGLSKEQKQQALETLFRDNLDFDWVAKFVMGRYWRQATDAQKTRYVPAYQKFLTKNYTSRFSDYSSGGFKVTGTKTLEKGDSQVSMEILSHEPGAQPVLIDYKVRRHAESFKVFDIIVEGVSMITTQRAEFTSVLNKSGIDGLIAQLEQK